MKFTARERRFRPVEARAFFFSKKASVLGTVGFEASSLDLTAISNGEPGDGGELDRVVAELLFMDHRRLGGFLWPSSRLVSEAPLSEPKAALSPSCELVRRKRLDIVRLKEPLLKFELEPRVERRDSGIGAGSSCSADGVAGVGVAAPGVDLDKLLVVFVVLFLRSGVAAAVFLRSRDGGFVSGTVLSARLGEKVAAAETGLWFSTPTAIESGWWWALLSG